MAKRGGSMPMKGMPGSMGKAHPKGGHMVGHDQGMSGQSKGKSSK